MKPHRQSVQRQAELPFAGIMVAAAGGSAMWIIAALIVWVVAR